jgi:hypothetical protein
MNLVTEINDIVLGSTLVVNVYNGGQEQFQVNGIDPRDGYISFVGDPFGTHALSFVRENGKIIIWAVYGSFKHQDLGEVLGMIGRSTIQTVTQNAIPKPGDILEVTNQGILNSYTIRSQTSD